MAPPAIANLLLCDLAAGLSEQAPCPWGGLPVVLAFGVRYGLSGSLVDGWLYALPVKAPAQPVLQCRDGRLLNEARLDLGSAFDLVAFALPGATQPAGRGNWRAGQSKAARSRGVRSGVRVSSPVSQPT